MSSVEQSRTALVAQASDRAERLNQSRGLRALWQSLSRQQLFCGLFILALVNGLADRAGTGLASLDLSALLAAA